MAHKNPVGSWKKLSEVSTVILDLHNLMVSVI